MEVKTIPQFLRNPWNITEVQTYKPLDRNQLPTRSKKSYTHRTQSNHGSPSTKEKEKQHCERRDNRQHSRSYKCQRLRVMVLCHEPWPLRSDAAAPEVDATNVIHSTVAADTKGDALQTLRLPEYMKGGQAVCSSNLSALIPLKIATIPEAPFL